MLSILTPDHHRPMKTNPITDGGPVFPTSNAFGNNYEGLTIRDHFAGMALAGWMAQPDERSTNTVDLKEEGKTIGQWQHEMKMTDARMCYDYADAMLAARHPQPEEK